MDETYWLGECLAFARTRVRRDQISSGGICGLRTLFGGVHGNPWMAKRIEEVKSEGFRGPDEWYK
jgi:hypothetical protein